jgi:multidrug efflux system membrane fusion protein
VFIIGEDSTVNIRNVKVSRQDDVRAVIATGLDAGEQLVTSGFARLADKAVVEVTSTEEVGQPPALPQVETQPKRKGRAAKGADKGGTGTVGADKTGQKGKSQAAGTQGSGAKSSATP